MDTKIQGFDRYNGLGYHGLGYHGLVIDKSTSSQTICQTNKPSNHYAQYASYHGYDGLSISFVYRRIQQSHIVRHLMSQIMGQRIWAGIGRTLHIHWSYIKPYIRDMGICGYRGLMV